MSKVKNVRISSYYTCGYSIFTPFSLAPVLHILRLCFPDLFTHCFQRLIVILLTLLQIVRYRSSYAATWSFFLCFTCTAFLWCSKLSFNGISNALLNMSLCMCSAGVSDCCYISSHPSRTNICWWLDISNCNPAAACSPCPFSILIGHHRHVLTSCLPASDAPLPRATRSRA